MNVKTNVKAALRDLQAWWATCHRHGHNPAKEKSTMNVKTHVKAGRGGLGYNLLNLN